MGPGDGGRAAIGSGTDDAPGAGSGEGIDWNFVAGINRAADSDGPGGDAAREAGLRTIHGGGRLAPGACSTISDASTNERRRIQRSALCVAADDPAHRRGLGKVAIAETILSVVRCGSSAADLEGGAARKRLISEGEAPR